MDIRSIFESVGSDDPIRSAFESVGSNSFDEQKFQSWYAAWAKKTGIDPDPDNPEHYYDYRAAFSAGVEPSIDPVDKQYHWSSQFKKEGHPRMVLDGVNTKTGQPVDPIRSAFEAAAGQSGPQLGPPVDVRALRGEPTRTVTDAISAVVPQEPANQSFAQNKPVFIEPKLSPRPVNAGGPQLSQRPPQIEPKKAIDQGIRQASADALNFLKALKAKEVRALEERLGADDPLVVKEKAKVWDDSPAGKFQKRLETEIAENPLPRPEGFKGYVQDMVRALLPIGASVGATYVGGPFAGMAATGSMIAGATERELSQARVDGKGRVLPAVKDPERRWKAAIFNAAGQSFLEQLPMSRALAAWKPGAAAKSVIAEMSKTGALEWFTETIQKVPELMSSVWARGAGKSPDQMLDEFTEGVGQALKEGAYEGAVVAPVSMLIGGGGAAMGKIKAGPQPIQADEIETPAQAKAFGIVADKDMIGDLKAARADAVKQRDRLTDLEEPHQDEIAVADLDNKIGLYDEALRNADNMQKVRQAFEDAAQEQTEPIGSQIVENEPQNEERLTDEPQQPPTLPEDQRTSEQPGEPAASGPGQQFDPVRSAFEAAAGADAAVPTVPDLATTEDAISFGEAATDQQVSELERLREQTKARLDELNAVPVESRDWNAVSQEAFKSQLYREAIEASRGEHPSQLEAGRPMYWDGDGKTQLSAEDAPAGTVETDQPPQLTDEQRQAVQKIYGAEIPILRTVFGKDLADRISVELKQMIDLGGANTDESLANWKARGVKPNTVLGATTFRGQRALMEISLAQDAKRQQWTFDHETFHIAAEWVLPPDQYATVLKAYGGNTEAAADGFARFMNGKSQPPEGIKKIFMQLKELLQRMGNFLRGSGFTSADKIFGDIASGGYAGKRRAGTGMYQGRAMSAEQRAPAWYSQMQKVFESKLPGSGTPAQIKQAIDGWAKKGEFKAEELEWSGVKEWLDQQTGKVTKQQVLDFVAANNVRVKEVVKGDNSELMARIEYLDGLLKAGNINQLRYDNAVARAKKDYPGSTKFSQYQLPGGDNYREVLLTLPKKKRTAGAIAKEMFGKDWAELSGKEKDAAIQRLADTEAKESGFRSSHWDEPNVLVHVRMNERTGPNGERILFLEEVQADKGQEWHKLSQKIKEGTATDADKKRFEFLDKNFPYNKTSSWVQLAFKRMVRYAAENGFDSIAWTPGDVQAERYDLSKQVSRVEYYAGSRNRLIATGLDGSDVLHEDGVTPEKLPDYIGKEAAERLMAQDPDANGLRSIEGEDLKVGGEGMKGFYDKILPAEVNAFFGKKAWGGAKVGKIDLPVSRDFKKSKYGITPARDVGVNDNRFVVIDHDYGFNENGIAFGPAFAEECRAWVRKEEGLDAPVSAWSLPITPQMRDKALHEGMTLFNLDDPISRREFIKRGGALIAWATVGSKVDKLFASTADFKSVVGSKGQTVDSLLKWISENSGSERFKKLAADVRGLLPNDGSIQLKVSNDLMTAKGVANVDRENGKVTVTLFGNGQDEATFLHEAIHAAVIARYDLLNYYLANPGKFGAHNADAALRQYYDVWNEFKESVAWTINDKGWKKEDVPLWLSEPASKPDEFLTYALTNQELRDWMGQKRYMGRTLLQKLRDAIKSFFDKYILDTKFFWIDAATITTDELLDAMKKDAPNFQTAARVLEMSGEKKGKTFNLDADNPGGMPPREPYARRPKSKNAIELPELTEMIKVLNSGKAPKLFQRMRDALGLFQHNDLAGIADVMIDPDLAIGQPIERAVIRLKGKTPAERKVSLVQQMQDFKDSVLSRYNVDPADMVFKSQYHRASGETHLSAIRKDPDVAAKVLSHELGHLDDWWAAAGDAPMVQGRGNILGRIAKLKGYINEYLAEYPGSPDEALTAADIGRLQKEAAKQKLDETTDKIIVEEIIREVPRFAETGVTAETILEIMRGRLPGESNIEVYRFLQTADSQTKKEVVKKALQDIVDERVPQTGRTQVGVDYIKETVTRRQAGKMPTQKEINERFKELLRKEIIKRKLYERMVIMDELKELTQQWKPFDLNMNKKYTAYRHKSSELYADAVSVMLQEPELLESVAPTFDKAMKMYASVRPDFTETLEGIRKDISGSQIGPRRLSKLYEMYERGEKVIADFYIRNRMEKRGLADTLFIILTDKNHGVLKSIRAAEKSGDPELIAKARKARYELEEAQYIASEMSAYVTDTVKNVIDPMTEKGATITDLGVYLFGRHVQANRKDMVSPGGHTSTTVEPMLEALEQKLGPEKYQAVKDAAEKYRKIREKYIIPRIEQSGIAAPELLQAIKARKEYARISVQHWLEEKHGKDITAQIYTPVGGALKAQKGTFSDSINAFTATLMQDISLLRSAHLNKAKTDLLDFLIDAGQVKPAEMKYDKGLGRMAPVRLEDPSRAYLSIMRDGTPYTYDVHRDIAKSFEYSAYESQKATEVINALNAPLRRLLVSNNPVWMIRNIFRDFRTTIKNIPEARVKSLPELAKLYKQAYGEVWEYVWKNNASDDIDALLRGKAITTDRVYGTKEMGYEDEAARIADEFNIQFNPELSKISQQRFKKARQILDVLDRFGRVSELGGKVAGYKFLKSQRDKGFVNPKTGKPRTDQEIYHVVRSRIGTPDFKRQGTGQIITNNLFMFSNVNKEGLRSALESFNEDRAAYVWKTVLYNILPKLVLAAASAQIPWVKEVVDGLTDYQKDHYTVIPIPKRLVPGLGAMDSFAFLIPEDYEGQLAGALVNKIARGEFGGTKGAINEASQLVPYRWHPAISVGADLLEYYVNGMNPVDDFRGSHILPDSIYKAGGFDAHKEMGKYVWNNLGMRMFYNAKQGELDPELAPLKEALQFPVLNWLSAIATVTNRGHAERYRRIIEPIRKEYARKAVESEGRIKGHINLMGYDVPRTAKVELYKALRQEDLLPSEQNFNAFEKRYNRIKNKGKDDQRIVQLEYANTNEEKAALLSQYEMELGAEQYNKLLQNLRRDGIISQETLLKKARGDKNGRNRRTNP